MSKLFINGKFLTQKFSGVQRFSYEISQRLSLFDKVEIVAPSNIERDTYRNISKIRKIGVTSGLLWEQIELPFFLNPRIDSYLLNLGNTAPVKYRRNIVTSHGLAWKFYPNAYSKKFTLWYSYLIPRILQNALLILSVSHSVKNELIEIFKIPEEKIEVLYPGVSTNFKPIKREIGNYILYVGTMQSIKNLDRLIEAFNIICKEEHNLELWIVGDVDKKIFRNFLLNKEKSIYLNRKIKFLGFMRDEELLKLYNSALCLVLPSFYESFGFPVLEALACGCPVVVSDIEVMHELVGDVAIYSNPKDPIDIASKTLLLIKDNKLRATLAAKGILRVKEFTWDKTYENLLSILKNRFNIVI